MINWLIKKIVCRSISNEKNCWLQPHTSHGKHNISCGCEKSLQPLLRQTSHSMIVGGRFKSANTTLLFDSEGLRHELDICCWCFRSSNISLLSDSVVAALEGFWLDVTLYTFCQLSRRLKYIYIERERQTVKNQCKYDGGTMPVFQQCLSTRGWIFPLGIDFKYIYTPYY